MGVALKLKDVSSCQHGVDKVGLRSGFRWFGVILARMSQVNVVIWNE